VAALKEPALKGFPIQSRFSVLKETGRLGCSGGRLKKKEDIANRTAYGFQLHNVRRDPKPDKKTGKMPPTVRGCFVPREGYYLLSIDYSQMELHSWAQVCIDLLGYSELANLLNSGIDIHCKLGGMVVNRPYEEVVQFKKKADWAKDARQLAKAGNFGFPGGLGPDGFVAYAKGSWGLTIERQQGVVLRDNWKIMCPEHRDYFSLISRLTDASGPQAIVQTRSNRLRGGVGFTDAANGMFQGLAADCAKDAGFYLAEACYFNTKSPLYGSHVVNMIHDEFLFEVPIAQSHEAAWEATKIMLDAGKRWMPDVPPTAEPALMMQWLKDAERREDANGRLIPWQPPA
jgi:DNA polymerase-1